MTTDALGATLIHETKQEASGIPWASIRLSIGIAFAACLILMARAPDAWMHPEFWAEDGADYWTTAFQHSVESIFMPGSGYIVVAPRLIAFASKFAPIADAPAIFAIGTLMAMLLTYWAIAGLDVLHARWLPLVMALTPTTGEILINPTNLQWHLSLLLPIAAFAPRLGRGQQIMLGFAAFTGPFAIFAAPVWLLRRRKVDRVGLTLVIMGAIIQIAAIFLTPQKAYAEGADSMIANYFDSMRQTFGVLSGNRGLYIELAMMAAIFTIARNHAIGQAGMIFGAIVIGVANLHFNNAATFDHYNGARYFFAFNVFAIWTCVSVALVPSWDRWLAIVTLVAIAISYPPDLFRRPALPKTDWEGFAKKVVAHQPASVPITPLTLDYDGKTFRAH